MNDDNWYKTAIFYEVYVRAYNDSNNDGHGDIPGLIQKLDYIQELGVDCLWLLPTYPSPLKDDGYDISDYYGVLSDYGTIEDFKDLVDAVHLRGMRLIIDLVLNHTSDQHPWFQESRKSRNSPYRDYYVWSDTNKKYQDARVIFVDTETSNWTWDDVAGQYYWHRFYSSQPDLNFDNSAVRQEMLNIMHFWLDLGIDGFRADAVPYLFEREGTNCENLPETHAYLKEIRRYLDEHFPKRVLLAEANQWPEDVREYFGNGDEFHMGFHFPVMPRIFMALGKMDRTPLVWIMNRTPEIPNNCQWCTFLRNHDELTLEMVTDDERRWMWDYYAPEERMRLNLGIRRRLAPLLDNDRRKIEMANSLLFTLPGSPIIYYGDEIGMGDNIWLPDRNGVRTPLQWENSNNAGFSDAQPHNLFAPVIEQAGYSPLEVNVAEQEKDPDSLLNIIRKMIRVRKRFNTFGEGKMEWLDAGTDAIAAYWRIDEEHRLLILNNLSPDNQNVVIETPQEVNISPVDLFSSRASDAVKVINEAQECRLQIELKPFQYLWLEI
jgi:maltose alpha-D-glucosyltransferase / alpha-amylase